MTKAKNPFTTNSIEISRLGMNDRVKRVLKQPVYRYNGSLVANIKKRLMKVTPTGETTATVSLLADPVAVVPKEVGRFEVSDWILEQGGEVLRVAKARAKAKAKAKPSTKAKAKPAAKAKAEPEATGFSIQAAIQAIMESDSDAETKTGAIAALMATS